MSSRRATRRTRLGLAAIAVVLGVAAAACGKKGPPLPPLRAIPQAASDFSVLQRGGELIFEFAYPATTAAGTVVGALEAVELLSFARPEAPAGSLAASGPVSPREFAAAARETLRITGSELASASDGDRVRLRLPLPPATTSFAVRNVGARSERSALSNIVTVEPGQPPPAPTGFTVTGAQEGVRLSWEPAPASAGTRVYRRDATRRAFGKPLATVAAGESSYLDASAQFGMRYVYTVVAFVVPAPPTPPVPAAPTATAPAAPDAAEPTPVAPPAAGAPSATPAPPATPTAPAPATTTPPAAPAAPAAPPPVATAAPIESAAAGEQEIHHVDRFPPAAPGRVVALADGGRIRIVWEASPARDVAGFVVSRQAAGEDFRPLGAEPIVELETTDTDVTPGARYRYRVAAVDVAGNVGDPSAAVEATAQ